jgi:ribose transport system permease protein
MERAKVRSAITGLAQLGAQEPVKRLVTGGVIVAAVIVDFYRTRKTAQT